MSRALLFLHDNVQRERAIYWIQKAPKGTRVEFRGPKRSIEQNARMWAMLTEISRQLVWHGQRYKPEEWKDFMMHMFRGEKWMPGEEGGVVPIGRATSDLETEEHTELTALIEAFAARQGVTLRDPAKEPA